MDLKKMYLQSLENAFELTKIAKTKDDVSLAKADVYARIALAIATTAIDIDDQPEETIVPAVSEIKNVEKVEEPEPAAPEPVHINPVIAELAKDAEVPLPPDRIEDETKEAREVRYTYLLDAYKDTAMKDLPEEVYPYLMPEANVNAIYEWLWNDAMHDDAAKRKESIIKDFTGGKMTSAGDIPLSLYLEKVIPCEQDWIYFMMFEDPTVINETLAKCTSNRYKDFRNLSNFSVGVWHTATQKYMENNFESIEKVS